MPVTPIYQDAKSVNKYRNGQIPFYILYNVKYRSPPHYHDYAELSLVVGGEGTETINGKKHTICRGTASFLLPHHIHEMAGNPDSPVFLYSCMFDLAILYDSSRNKFLLDDLMKVGSELPSYCMLDEEQTNRLENLMIDIKHEYENGKYGREAVICSKLTEALVLIMRDFKKERTHLRHEQTKSDSNISVRFPGCSSRSPGCLRTGTECSTATGRKPAAIPSDPGGSSHEKETGTVSVKPRLFLFR